MIGITIERNITTPKIELTIMIIFLALFAMMGETDESQQQSPSIIEHPSLLYRTSRQ